MRKFSIREKIGAGVGAIVLGILYFFGEKIGESLLNLTSTVAPTSILSISDSIISGLIIVGIIVVIYALHALRKEQSVSSFQKEAERPPTVIEPIAPQSPTISSTRTAIRNKTFNNEKVVLYGYSWLSCTFNQCIIAIDKGDFDLVGCTVTNSHFVFGPDATNILRIALMLSSDMLSKLKEELVSKGNRFQETQRI